MIVQIIKRRVEVEIEVERTLEYWEFWKFGLDSANRHENGRN